MRPFYGVGIERVHPQEEVQMAKVERPKRQSIIQRLVVIILISLSFGVLALDVSLDSVYFETRPRSPLPEEGRVYPEYVHHGALVYLTKLEKLQYEYSSVVVVVLFGAGALLHRRWSGAPL